MMFSSYHLLLIAIYHGLFALNLLDCILITSHPADLPFYMGQQFLLLVRVMRRQMTGSLIQMLQNFRFLASSCGNDCVMFLFMHS